MKLSGVVTNVYEREYPEADGSRRASVRVDVLEARGREPQTLTVPREHMDAVRSWRIGDRVEVDVETYRYSFGERSGMGVRLVGILDHAAAGLEVL